LKDVDEISARKTPWKGLEGFAPVPDEICLVEAFKKAANHRLRIAQTPAAQAIARSPN